MRFAVMASILGALVLAPGAGRAGPPYATDDPEPVDYRHWEFYVASQVRMTGSGLDGTAPHVEVNYGVQPGIQLHLIAPAAFHRADGRTRYGFGDLELGVKVRLLREEGAVPMVGVFPLVQVPTGNPSRGLGNGAAQLFLPLWIQKRWGPWQTCGGAGYGINWARDGKDWWFVGWQAQYSFPSVATLGAEVTYATSHDRGGESDFAFNIGLVLDVNANHHLLLSAGRDILGPTRVQGYLAYQWTFGPKAEGD